MDNNIPKKLYKYCNINENTLDNIIKDQFFLSKATNLNDCLEMMGYCGKDIGIPNPEINDVFDLYEEFVKGQGAGSEESYKNNANIMELFI